MSRKRVRHVELIVMSLAACSDESSQPTGAPIPAPTATPTSTPTDTITSVPMVTPTPTPTVTSTPTNTPTPTAPPTAEEIILNTPVEMPRAMMFAMWSWDEPTDEITVTVDFQNDIEYRGDQGLYFIACTPFAIGNTSAYFGLQTDVNTGPMGGRRNIGKGAIFSVWDVPNDKGVRGPEDSWVEQGDYEGKFLSVRRAYDWGAGQHTLRLSAEETDEEGRWFSLHVNELWMGSLRIPLVDGGARIQPNCGSAVEVYGGPPVKPSAIPYWNIVVAPPQADGQTADLTETFYPENVESLRNTLITREDVGVRFEVGLDYIAHE